MVEVVWCWCAVVDGSWMMMIHDAGDDESPPSPAVSSLAIKYPPTLLGGWMDGWRAGSAGWAAHLASS